MEVDDWFIYITLTIEIITKTIHIFGFREIPESNRPYLANLLLSALITFFMTLSNAKLSTSCIGGNSLNVFKNSNAFTCAGTRA
jgi:hypothetical protein